MTSHGGCSTENPSLDYDFIVVGAGTAGCYLAHKLTTAVAAPRVLLLETGHDTLRDTSSSDNPNFLPLIPGMAIENLSSDRYNYKYKTARQTYLNNRELIYHRGRGLGGTSSVNYMAWVKGYRGDFQAWADLVGDSAYSADEGWRRIQKLENFDPTALPESYKSYAAPDMADHGTTGVIHNTLPREPIPGMRMFLDACEDAGCPKIMDTNSGNPIGSGVVQMTIWKGARSSSATQLLNTEDSLGKGIQRRNNLEVKVETKVQKVLFSGKKAIGVEVSGGRKYYASKEVIISAGFIDSPKLLLLSGVGPEEQLQKHGIEVVADAPNVGKNLLDHSTLLLDPIFRQDLNIPTWNSTFSDPSRVKTEKETWIRTYQSDGEAKGDLTKFGGSAAVAFIKYPQSLRETWPEWNLLSSEEKSLFLDPKRPDTEVFYLTGYLPPGQTIPEGRLPNSYARVFLLHQNCLARGSITLSSANPEEPPVIDPQYFSHPMDRRIAVETVKSTLKIFRAKSCHGVVEGMEFVAPDDPPFLQADKDKMKANLEKSVNGFYLNGLDDEKDETIEKWLREVGLDQGYHGMGTCRMGKDGDPLQVVDSSGKVIGVEGLRVADTSVVPIVMNNHPQVSAYLVADVVADRLLEEWEMVSANGEPENARKKRKLCDNSALLVI